MIKAAGSPRKPLTTIQVKLEKKIKQGGKEGGKEAVDLVTCDKAPPEYWEELAEQRRVALDEALKENRHLTDKIKTLEAENRDLEEMLAEAKTLAEMINTMSSEANDSGIGKDASFDTSVSTD